MVTLINLSSVSNRDRKQQAKRIRVFRKAHRTTGIALFLFFIVVASTGLLLGWKKNSDGIILPHTIKGSSTELATWLPIDQLSLIALDTIQQHLNRKSMKVDRIDVRPDKGMIKVTFQDTYWSVQVDGETGKVLQIARRNSDLFENIHDGSIVDNVLGISGGIFKLLFTSVMGFALLTFSITGFWLWYGPKRMRNSR